MNYFTSTIIIDVIGFIVASFLYLNCRHEKRDILQVLFNCMLVTNMIVLPIDAVSWFINGNTTALAMSMEMLTSSIVFMLQTISCWLWFLYTDVDVFERRAVMTVRNFLYSIPMLIEGVLLIINIFTEKIFFIDKAGYYHRGDWFAINSVIYIAYLLAALAFAMIGIFRSKEKEKKRRCIYLAFFMIMPVCAIVMQMIFIGYSLISTFASLSYLLIYLNVQNRRLTIEKINAAKKENELTQMKVSIMLSQIQPHFLYNALNTIQYLCEHKPDEASKAVESFARYLRGNMDSINEKMPIPLIKEIEHLKQYLIIEQMRFPNVKIIYDIRCSNFSLPSLTIQPLVENAIRCGLNHKEGGGTVVVSSFETDKNYVVKISDNGIGFDQSVEKNDGEKHTGISNTRDRLASMCSGLLKIESYPDVGTAVIITIPKEQKKK